MVRFELGVYHTAPSIKKACPGGLLEDSQWILKLSGHLQRTLWKP
jgi:hypothetical protein